MPPPIRSPATPAIYPWDEPVFRDGWQRGLEAGTIAL